MSIKDERSANFGLQSMQEISLQLKRKPLGNKIK